MLGLALAASRLSVDLTGSPLRFVAWVVPWLPPATRGADLLSSPSPWLYALAHAGATSAIAALLVRRCR
jgi:hypothetical protein